MLACYIIICICAKFKYSNCHCIFKTFMIDLLQYEPGTNNHNVHPHVSYILTSLYSCGIWVSSNILDYRVQEIYLLNKKWYICPSRFV